MNPITLYKKEAGEHQPFLLLLILHHYGTNVPFRISIGKPQTVGKEVDCSSEHFFSDKQTLA